MDIVSSDEDDDSSSQNSAKFAQEQFNKVHRAKTMRISSKSHQEELLLLKLKGKTSRNEDNILYFDSNDEMYTHDQMLTIKNNDMILHKQSISLPSTPK